MRLCIHSFEVQTFCLFVFLSAYLSVMKVLNDMRLIIRSFQAIDLLNLCEGQSSIYTDHSAIAQTSYVSCKYWKYRSAVPFTSSYPTAPRSSHTPEYDSATAVTLWTDFGKIDSTIFCVNMLLNLVFTLTLHISQFLHNTQPLSPSPSL